MGIGPRFRRPNSTSRYRKGIRFLPHDSGAVDWLKNQQRILKRRTTEQRHQDNRRVQEIIENSWPLANDK